jgi:hypothetical protein
MESLSGDDLFQLDSMTLVENQRQEREETESRNREAEDRRKMPGLVQRLTVEQLLDRQRREKAAKAISTA